MRLSKERRERIREDLDRDPLDDPLQDNDEIESLLDLAGERDRYRALLRDLREYFDNYADVTDSPRGVAELPNEEMEWKQAIDTALEGKTND